MSSRQSRTVFVIMPFTRSPTRGKEQMTSFFENNIKRPIENSDLQYEYRVHRSGDTFNITEAIITDLYDADIVIADLSGRFPNPNVMYELGVRLSFSDQPVILIREDRTDNADVFDISSFYIFPYDPLNYAQLENHLIGKLARFESGEEGYRSPVREVLGSRLAKEHAGQTPLSPDEEQGLVLEGIVRVGEAIGRALGPRGKGVRRQRASGDVTRAHGGFAIAQALQSSRPAVQAGIDLCGQLAEEVDQTVGDGTKICIGLFAALVREGIRLVRAGENWTSLMASIEMSADASRAALATKAWQTSTEDLAGVVGTAAGSREIGSKAVKLMEDVEPDGLIGLEGGGASTDEITVVEGFRLGAGYASEHLLGDNDGGAWTRGSARVLLYPHELSSMRDVVPVLESFALNRVPLVLLAKRVEGEALTTIEVNNRNDTTDVMVVQVPGVLGRSGSVFDDLAVYTGGSVISDERGFKLENATESNLGWAKHVTVDRTSTLVVGGGGGQAALRAYADRLRGISGSATEYEQALVKERIAMLTAKISTVAVGGATRDDRRRRLDAWNSAIRAAHGAPTALTILGGGKPLAMVATDDRGLGSDMTPRDGGEVFALACMEPLKALARNANRSPTEVLDATLEARDESVSLDAVTGELGDLRKEGVLDSLAVWDRAIEVAVSGARTFFETSHWMS